MRHILVLSGAVWLLLLASGLQPAAAETVVPSALEQRLTQLELAVKALPPTPTINTGDNTWVLVSTALVLMMTAPGLILFYGGLVRSKNVLSTMMHSLVLMGIMSILWMVYGYSMAFGEGNAVFGNPLQYLFLQGVSGSPNPDYAATIPHQSFMLFQIPDSLTNPCRRITSFLAWLAPGCSGLAGLASTRAAPWGLAHWRPARSPRPISQPPRRP